MGRRAEGSTTTLERAAAPPAAPVVDIVVPVYNEASTLGASVMRLHAFLRAGFPFSWRVTIADNASTDDTWALASRLAAALPGVRAVHLDRKGRGAALREAWGSSDASVVAYMDVDLSTDLNALLPLVAPLVSGHSDVAIGSRLAAGAAVARRPKRELISRAYNLLLRMVFSVRFRDAQCGFKAIRADVGRALLAAIENDNWFFDTELLLLAEHNGLRVHEVPVDWVDDPDSRVHIVPTAAEDLRGAARMAWRFARGQGHIDLTGIGRAPLRDDFGRRLVSFGIIGAVSTAASLAIFAALHDFGAITANAIAVTATFAGNTWANRRLTVGPRWAHTRSAGRHWLGAAAVYVGALVLTTAALAGVHAVGGGVGLELAALALTWTVASIVRLGLVQSWARRV